MGIFALFLLGLAGWMIWTGRLQRMKANDGIALALAIVGALVAAKGKPFLGAIPLMLSLSYTMLRLRGKNGTVEKAKKPDKSRTASTAAVDPGVAEASALLGIPADADPKAIRAAHRRLIASVHPDKGGTEALAAKINEARDIMLRHHETSTLPRH